MHDIIYSITRAHKEMVTKLKYPIFAEKVHIHFSVLLNINVSLDHNSKKNCIVIIFAEPCVNIRILYLVVAELRYRITLLCKCLQQYRSILVS